MTSHDSDQDASAATLLLVDDDPHVLSELGRVLRHAGYRLLIATSGESALSVVEEDAVDLVISATLLSDMDGAELLSRIQHARPDCLRVLLADQASMDTMVRATNEGHIHSIITKPWNDDVLCLTIRRALAHQQADNERKRLAALTQVQNRELVELNAGLEQQVAARTQELQEVADMLDAAYAELKRSYVTATRVFSSLINLRLPRHLQINARVGNLITAFAKAYGLDDKLRHDLLMAAALYNLGKLTWDDHLLNTPAQRLFGEQEAVYRRYPETGDSLLMALDYLGDTATLIRHHRERWNGSGYPDRLVGEAIPYGARLLGLAVDFIELQRGMILPRKVPRQEALALLRKFSGRVYDPALCKPFVELCLEQAPDLGLAAGQAVLSLDTHKVEPGMRLMQDLHSDAGTLLLREGKVLTRDLIDKLTRFEAGEGARYTLLVHPPGDRSEDN